MKENIEIYIPKGEEVPTELRLKKGKVYICYERLKDEFGYEFKLYELENKEQGENIVREIANIMCNQSYDHGQEWRIDVIKCIEYSDNSWGNSGKWCVEFRIKDSY